MSTFAAGDRVVLDGEAWDEVPKKGQIVTIERIIFADLVHAVGTMGTFTVWGEEWIVWGEDGHPFHGSPVTEEPNTTEV